MTTDEILLAVTSIVVLGVAAQWLAWRFRWPSILLLLVVGLLAGPVTGLLDPDELLGDLLVPIVSLSVALILFEGGLNLDVSELRAGGGVARNLVTVGVAITALIGGLTAWALFDVDASVAALLGAIVVVTGPTVIGPLLRHVRPVGRVSPILRTEGILIDPVGAMLAVIVFEVILEETVGEAADTILVAIMKTVGLGSLIGLGGALFLVLVFKRFLVPDELHNLLVLGVVLAVSTGADIVQEESGLLAATVMGIALASQRITPVQHIVEFNETVRVLLISGLFVLLAARLDAGSVGEVLVPGLGFLAVLVVVARPAAVAVSTWRSDLAPRERAFLAWMAPRGIVAAAVSSIFAIRLAEAGAKGADILVPATFIVIIGTIALYGGTASKVAGRLGLADPEPQGVLFIGAQGWARQIAEELMEHGFKVVLVDNDRANVATARLAGMQTHYGNVLSERVLREIDLGGIGRVLALTRSDEVNSLAAEHFARVLGRRETFQLAPADSDEESRGGTSTRFLARRPFGSHTYNDFERWYRRGAAIKATHLTEEFGLDELRARYEWGAVPLFLIRDSERLEVFSEDGGLRAGPGDVVVSLVHPDALEGEVRAEGPSNVEERRRRALEEREGGEGA